jgi:hypothetical protein
VTTDPFRRVPCPRVVRENPSQRELLGSER